MFSGCNEITSLDLSKFNTKNVYSIESIFENCSNFVTINVDDVLAEKLIYLGIVDDSARIYNVGNSDYSKHVIQPWSIWLDYNLDPWDADIVKRVLRTKIEPGLSETESRILDYNKIIHICKEKIRQLSKDV